MSLIQGLSQEEQKKLGEEWDTRLSHPLAFVPHYLREQITVEEAERNNFEFGAFAAEYLKGAIRQSSPAQNPFLVCVGFGKGHDCRTLKEAIGAGLKTFHVDVSPNSCKLARKKMLAQSREIGLSPGNRRRHYEIVHGEIQSLLAEPESMGPDFELDKVQIWYLSRLLGCLTEFSATLVLRELGWVSLSSQANPDCTKSIVVINTLRDFNPDIVGKTNTLWQKADILKQLECGAGRRVVATREEYWHYYNQRILAMTIKSQPE